MSVPSKTLAQSRLTPRVLAARLMQGRGPISADRRKFMAGLAFIAPALAALGATFIYPLVYNAWLSLHSYNLAEIYLGVRFVGLGNYAEILRDPYFWSALRNS